MKKDIHPNYILSSNLIFGSIGLGLINVLVQWLSSSEDRMVVIMDIMVIILSLLIVAAMGFLVRQGYGWMKYVLLVLTVLGLIGIPFILYNFSKNPLAGVINIIETVMQVWATVILFRIPKPAVENVVEQL
jgi:hypothetical protein